MLDTTLGKQSVPVKLKLERPNSNQWKQGRGHRNANLLNGSRQQHGNGAVLDSENSTNSGKAPSKKRKSPATRARDAKRRADFLERKRACGPPLDASKDLQDLVPVEPPQGPSHGCDEEVKESAVAQPDCTTPPALPDGDGLALSRGCGADADLTGEASVETCNSFNPDSDADDSDDVYSAGCCNVGCDVTDPNLLKKCTRCKMALYCSRVCQTKDWKMHKLLCDAVASGSLKFGN